MKKITLLFLAITCLALSSWLFWFRGTADSSTTGSTSESRPNVELEVRSSRLEPQGEPDNEAASEPEKEIVEMAGQEPEPLKLGPPLAPQRVGTVGKADIDADRDPAAGAKEDPAVGQAKAPVGEPEITRENLVVDLSSDEARARTVAAMRAIEDREMEEVEAWGERTGNAIKGDGWIVDRIEEDRPIYLETHNRESAASINVTPIRQKGYRDGSGQVAGVWDGGSVRDTHQEFGDRVTVRDASQPDNHATHVGGTIGAGGVKAGARGMAPAVAIESYDWTNDDSEIMERAATTAAQARGGVQDAQGRPYIAVSNHSYGFPSGWRFSDGAGWQWLPGGTPQLGDLDPGFGMYSAESREVDEIAVKAPYYLMVRAAGNPRGGGPSDGDSFFSWNGSGPTSFTYDSTLHPAPNGPWDCINIGAASAKNTLTVGNYTNAARLSGELLGARDTLDAIGDVFGFFLGQNIFSLGAYLIDEQPLVRNVFISNPNSSSAFGPVDDGRIKPEIVAVGTDVFSPIANADNSYASYNGTSMAAPAVTGAVVLINQHYQSLFPDAMRASTVKGLLLHTATDIGDPGPDYSSGFGFLDAKAAVDLISEHRSDPSKRLLEEANLREGRSAERFVERIPGKPLKVTLSWTDPKGAEMNGLNNRTPVLVNDLDLRIYAESGAEVRPYVRDPDNPIALVTRGDNLVDPVEQILIGPNEFPGATRFRVVVRHKGELQGGHQVYSLISSGVGRAATFNEAVDNDELVFTAFGGSAAIFGWGPQVVETADGVDAVRSPALWDNGSTGFQTTVQGPGRIVFSARVDADGGDGLRFSVNGNQAGTTLSGSSGWTERSHVIPAGSHNLSWAYMKDASGSAGRDAAFVDRISYRGTPYDLEAEKVGSFTEVRWSFPGASQGFTLFVNPAGPSLAGAASRTVAGQLRAGEDRRFTIDSTGGAPWYALRVNADKNGRVGELSAWVQASLRLLRPSGFRASYAVFGDRIRLTWDPVDGATEYEVTRVSGGGSPQSWIVSGTTFDDLGAPVAEEVTYTLVARDGVTGTESPVAGPAAGLVVDPATFLVAASDDQARVRVTWRNPYGTDWFRCVRTTTSVSPAAGNKGFVEIGRGRTSVVSRHAGFTDATGQVGVTYHYWAQTGYYDPSGNGEVLWGDVLSGDSGVAVPPESTEYRVVDSDTPGGPFYVWVDVSKSGSQVLGRQLLQPTEVALQASSQFYGVSGCINGSGLSAVPNISNYQSVSHAQPQANNSWVTNPFFPDYFGAGAPNPALFFTIEPNSFFGVGYDLTDLVVWGYQFGYAGGNEARVFKVDFYERYLPPGAFLTDWRPTGQSVTVTSPQATTGQPLTLPFGASYRADGVKITILDNWDTETTVGGDRVGLGEVRFIGKRRPGAGGPTGGAVSASIFGVGTQIAAAAHGYLANTSDNWNDATNDTNLPVLPNNGGDGRRFLPYHDAIELGATGAVYVGQTAFNHPDISGRVWQWENVQLAGGSAPFSFQVIESGGDVLFQYKPGNPGGSGATIGIQDPPAGKAAVYSVNENSIPTDRGFSILFEEVEPGAVNDGGVRFVSTLSDEDNGGLGLGAGDSLRELLKYGSPGDDGVLRIQFPPGMAGQTIALGSTLVMDRGGRYEVDGSNAPGLVISGQDIHQIFYLDATSLGSGSVWDLTLKNLTLADGNVAGDGGAIGTAPTGFYAFTVKLEGVTVRDCVAIGGRGGAVALKNTSHLTMVNSTISGCTAELGGGAIWLKGEPDDVTYTILSSTIASNTTTNGRGGGILNEGDDPVQLLGSIVADNSSTINGPDIFGPSGSVGYNLIGSSLGVTGLAANDLKDLSSGIESLADNGGPTWTHALAANSPAIDRAADAAGGIFQGTDQRGVQRGADGDLDLTTGPGGPDIGAYERIADLIVTTGADVVDPDDNAVSLREAVAAANLDLGGSITFDTLLMGTSVCSLSSELSLVVPRGLRIEGGAGMTLNAAGGSRIFSIAGGSEVLLSDLTLRDGDAGSGDGGAILNHGELTMFRCSVKDSSALSGGGIKSTGSLNIFASTFSGNETAPGAGEGGAIQTSGGKMLLERCTFSGNFGFFGGAIDTNDTALVLRAVTVAGNSLFNFGAVGVTGGSLSIQDSLLADNVGGSNIYRDATAAFEDLGGNLIEASGQPVDARLFPLADYGGPTQTRPPGLGSPALDRAGGLAPLALTGSALISPTVSNSSANSGPEAALDGDPATKFVSSDQALVAHWPLDNGPSAAFGPFNGVASGNLSFGSTPAPGLSGGSADFTAGSIRIPWSEELNPPSYTVTLWAQADVRGGGSFRSPITNRDGAASPYGYMLYNDANGNWNHWSGRGTGTQWDMQGGGAVQIGKWTHLALSYDAASSTKRLFVDGVLAAETVVPLTPNGPDQQSFKIGAGGDDDDPLSFPFDGRIDDVALWSRPLSAAEIQQVATTGVQSAAERIVIEAEQRFIAPGAIQITAAGDTPGADPAQVSITGSDDGVDFELIATLTIPAFEERGATQVLSFTPTRDYRQYGIAFPVTADPSLGLLQVAEVALVTSPDADQRGLPLAVDGDGDGVAGSDAGAAETQVQLVDTPEDEPVGAIFPGRSLREAVEDGAGSIVRFDRNVFRGRPLDVVSLTEGEIPVTAPVAIDAAPNAGVEVSAGGVSRHFRVEPGAELTLAGMTLRDGYGSPHGGSLLVEGTARLERCVVRNNESELSAGAAEVVGGTMHLFESTVADNLANQFAGGLRGANGAHLIIERSTVSGNTGNLGAGLRLVASTAEIRSSTIAENSGVGLNLHNGASAVLTGSTLAANSGAGVTLSGSSPSSLTHGNIIVAGNGAADLPTSTQVNSLGGSVVGGDPKLAPLGYYGGPTETMALLAGSPALDAGVDSLVPAATDQRGFSRVAGSAPDAGAFESQALSFVPTVDTDSDGIDDEWEVFYGFAPGNAADAVLDLDRDGHSTLDEFLARTNPLLALSGLKVVGTERRADVFRLEWLSETGVTYSVWQSGDLENWSPVPGSNLIAASFLTRFDAPLGGDRAFYQVRVGQAPGIDAPRLADPGEYLEVAHRWEDEGVAPKVDNATVTQWADTVGALDLVASGGPVYRAGVLPLGGGGVEFRGGGFNDALAAATGPLDGSDGFTVAVAFQAGGPGEFTPGGDAYQMAQLASTAGSGDGDDWTLARGDGSVWFGLGDASFGKASLAVPETEFPEGAWVIAVATWFSNAGDGTPRCGLWLYDHTGALVAGSGLLDPNGLTGTSGGFDAPRDATRFAIGGLGSDATAGNFDGLVGSVRFYDAPSNSVVSGVVASQISSELLFEAPLIEFTTE